MRFRIVYYVQKIQRQNKQVPENFKRIFLKFSGFLLSEETSFPVSLLVNPLALVAYSNHIMSGNGSV